MAGVGVEVGADGEDAVDRLKSKQRSLSYIPWKPIKGFK